MWCNQKSIKVVVDQLLRSTPPYCANPKCEWHQPEVAEREGRFVRNGKKTISRYPYVSVRFKCHKCKKTFSSSFFTLNYRDRERDTYEEIFDLKWKGWSYRQIAEHLKLSLDTVLRRAQKMARRGILIQAKLMEKVIIDEPVVFDGIENFCFSQYDPNNINHVVGSQTYFLYDFNFSPMNRKGRMSPRQKLKKKQLENKHGRYPKASIHAATKRIFQRLQRKSMTELVLHTDNHYAYRDVLKKLPKKPPITHLITPAKNTRNYKNALFAINHMDMLTRHHSSAFKRETIAFRKHTIAMQEDFALQMIGKNFLRSIFVKKHKRDPSTNVESPAMRVGIATKIQTFTEFYKTRVTTAQVKLNQDWKAIVERVDVTSRQPILRYSGI
jgi:transposase-like protein